MSLVDEALGRLQRTWHRAPALGVIHADHHERAVFEIVTPVGRAVVKVDTSLRRHATERAMLAAAVNGGLPVPSVIHADTDAPPILVLEYLSGLPLSTGSAEAWRHAGALLRLLHEQTPPVEVTASSWSERTWVGHFAWWADHEHRQLSERHVLPADTLAEMHQLLAEAFAGMEEPELRLLHGDCQPDHYLLGERRVNVTGVIDFGDAVSGDAAWDLAVITLAHPEHVGDVLAGYKPDDALQDRIGQLLLPYWLIRRLGSASWMQEHGYDHRPDLHAAQALLTGATEGR